MLSAPAPPVVSALFSRYMESVDKLIPSFGDLDLSPVSVLSSAIPSPARLERHTAKQRNFIESLCYDDF